MFRDYSEGFQRFSEFFRDPLRGRFPSQRLSVVLALELSPKFIYMALSTATPTLILVRWEAQAVLRGVAGVVVSSDGRRLFDPRVLLCTHCNIMISTV